MIRRKKTTIFTDAKDTTTVLELKKMIEGMYWIIFFLRVTKIIYQGLLIVLQVF